MAAPKYQLAVTYLTPHLDNSALLLARFRHLLPADWATLLFPLALVKKHKTV
jgi:hypothetical protein